VVDGRGSGGVVVVVVEEEVLVSMGMARRTRGRSRKCYWWSLSSLPK
jgi:hypothetical protein